MLAPPHLPHAPPLQAPGTLIPLRGIVLLAAKWAVLDLGGRLFVQTLLVKVGNAHLLQPATACYLLKVGVAHLLLSARSEQA